MCVCVYYCNCSVCVLLLCISNLILLLCSNPANSVLLMATTYCGNLVLWQKNLVLCPTQPIVTANLIIIIVCIIVLLLLLILCV
ncbi:hypothetical protein ACI2OX_22510 [Bacillus sp. N9]